MHSRILHRIRHNMKGHPYIPSNWIEDLCQYFLSRVKLLAQHWILLPSDISSSSTMASSGSEPVSTSSATDRACPNVSVGSTLPTAITPISLPEETDQEIPIVGNARTEESQVVERIALTDLWRQVRRGNRLAAYFTRDIFEGEGEAHRGITLSWCAESCNSVVAKLAAMAPTATVNDNEDSASDSEWRFEYKGQFSSRRNKMVNHAIMKLFHKRSFCSHCHQVLCIHFSVSCY